MSSQEDDQKRGDAAEAAESGSQNGTAAGPAHEEAHGLAVGQLFSSIDELKVRLQEYALHHGFYVNISTELSSAGRTPRLRARCNRAGKPPAAYSTVPENKKRRRTSLKVGCSWELVAHITKDHPDGGPPLWKITAFDPQHGELCRPGLAQLELLGNHKRRKRHSLPAGAAAAATPPSTPGSATPAGTPSLTPVAAAAAAAAAIAAGSSLPPTPGPCAVAASSAAAAAAAAVPASPAPAASASANGTMLVTPTHLADAERAGLESGASACAAGRGEEAVPAPRRRRRLLQQEFTDVANLACLSAQHTAVVRQLMTQLVPQLRDGDEDLTLGTLLDAIRARVTASQSALPLAAEASATPKAAVRHCSFCNLQTHTARSCSIKKSFGILLSNNDIDFSPLPPIVASAGDVQTLDFIPSHMCAVQLRATVPAAALPPHGPAAASDVEVGPDASGHRSVEGPASNGAAGQPLFAAALFTLADVQALNMDVPVRLVTWWALLAWSNDFKSSTRSVFVVAPAPAAAVANGPGPHTPAPTAAQPPAASIAVPASPAPTGPAPPPLAPGPAALIAAAASEHDGVPADAPLSRGPSTRSAAAAK